MQLSAAVGSKTLNLLQVELRLIKTYFDLHITTDLEVTQISKVQY